MNYNLLADTGTINPPEHSLWIIDQSALLKKYYFNLSSNLGSFDIFTYLSVNSGISCESAHFRVWLLTLMFVGGSGGDGSTNKDRMRKTENRETWKHVSILIGISKQDFLLVILKKTKFKKYLAKPSIIHNYWHVIFDIK